MIFMFFLAVNPFVSAVLCIMVIYAPSSAEFSDCRRKSACVAQVAVKKNLLCVVRVLLGDVHSVIAALWANLLLFNIALTQIHPCDKTQYT